MPDSSLQQKADLLDELALSCRNATQSLGDVRTQVPLTLQPFWDSHQSKIRDQFMENYQDWFNYFETICSDLSSIAKYCDNKSRQLREEYQKQEAAERLRQFLDRPTA